MNGTDGILLCPFVPHCPTPPFLSQLFTNHRLVWVLPLDIGDYRPRNKEKTVRSNRGKLIEYLTRFISSGCSWSTCRRTACARSVTLHLLSFPYPSQSLLQLYWFRVTTRHYILRARSTIREPWRQVWEDRSKRTSIVDHCNSHILVRCGKHLSRKNRACSTQRIRSWL